MILLALYDYLAHHTSRFTTDHFLDVTPSNNNKKLEKLQRSSFVDYVSEVIPRPSHASTLGSSNSTLTSSHRELSVKSQPRPSTGGSKYKYSGGCQTGGVWSLTLLIVRRILLGNLSVGEIRNEESIATNLVPDVTVRKIKIEKQNNKLKYQKNYQLFVTLTKLFGKILTLPC